MPTAFILSKMSHPVGLDLFMSQCVQQIQYERHFLTALVKGQNEGLQGKTVPHEEVKEQLRERYSSPKKSATK
jgi:predicted transcriptional regulator